MEIDLELTEKKKTTQRFTATIVYYTIIWSACFSSISPSILNQLTQNFRISVMDLYKDVIFLIYYVLNGLTFAILHIPLRQFYRC